MADLISLAHENRCGPKEPRWESIAEFARIRCHHVSTSIWLVKTRTFVQALKKKNNLPDSQLMTSVGLSITFTDVLKAISLLRGSK